ncbi:hypothetical protein QFC22_000523 [Naganishia vaughanmartiniae]|uniref:Uncharacterized protein n=1 Tax=Naganishia vaughanmartiniae TaxID=1424756 RepID=A0ACC2XRC2_9TREE|nr:hypothetical protein QFC22_000523 [Naganishia vaughanmartiniae]
MVGPLAVVIPEPVIVYPQGTRLHNHNAHNAVGDLENGNREKQVPKRKKPLFTVSLPTPLPIPLISRSTNKQLPHHSYHLHISISHPATLLAYTHKAWLNGSAHFAVHVPRVIVVPADTRGLFVWWRRWIRVEQKDLVIPQGVEDRQTDRLSDFPVIYHALITVRLPVPIQTPDLVPEFAGIPGPDDDLADYITLESYGFHTAALPAVPGHNQDDDDNNNNPAAVGDSHNPPNMETSDGTSRQRQAQTLSRQEKDGKKQLRVSAVASARNPFYNTTLINLAQRPISMPLELGFGIFLSANKQPSAILDQVDADADAGPEKGIEMRSEGKRRKEDRLVKMAEVVTMPLSLHGQERVRIHVEGVVKAGRRHTDDTSEDEDGAALSTFLNNYLQGRSNNVTILGLPAFPIDASPDARINVTNPSSGSSVVPPAWMQRLVSENVHAVIPFPAPSNRTNLIRSVTIEQMKISERAGKMRASGVVVVVATLPQDLAGVEVQVVGVLPDVLVSDGKFEGGGEVDPGTPPYPARAFGRIHPTEFLPAISSPSPDDPTLLIVRAPLHDVPLDILPGRDKVLSDFVAKIVFKGFAEAGIVGNAGVRVDVVGVGKAVEVRKVPVTGVVNVGRPRVV